MRQDCLFDILISRKILFMIDSKEKRNAIRIEKRKKKRRMTMKIDPHR